jgi:disulfide bond formation protein DsbB
MTVGSVSLFYALLALVANAFVLGVVGLAISGRLHIARDAVAPIALPAAFVVAVLATAGSLYFSEVAGFEPCRLCWYQRIAMYPLVVVLAVAGWRRDPGVRRYVIPVAAIGACISAYHYTLEWLPWLDSGACSADVPCTLVWFRQLGFISLPYLALSAFVLLIALVWLGSAPSRTPDHDPSDGGHAR